MTILDESYDPLDHSDEAGFVATERGIEETQGTSDLPRNAVGRFRRWRQDANSDYYRWLNGMAMVDPEAMRLARREYGRGRVSDLIMRGNPTAACAIMALTAKGSGPLDPQAIIRICGIAIRDGVQSNHQCSVMESLESIITTESQYLVPATVCLYDALESAAFIDLATDKRNHYMDLVLTTIAAHADHPEALRLLARLGQAA